MIDLHYVRTSNGLKIAIMMEETQLAHRVINYDIFAGDHLKPEFKKINPNHKLPAMVDRAPEDKGGPITVFESGAILQYLARKSGKLLSSDLRRHFMTLQWLTWQVAGLGPMLGQASHFVRYAPEGQQYGIERYTREARRLLNVLEFRLAQEEYLAVDFSIADIACWPWIQNVHNYDIDLAEFPAITRWNAAIKARPSVIATTQVEGTSIPAAWVKKRMTLTPEQWSNMYGDRMLEATRTAGP